MLIFHKSLNNLKNYFYIPIMFKKSINYGIGLWICLTQAFSSPLQTVAVFIDDQVEQSQDSSSAIYARESLSASVSGKGFQVITHETVSKSLNNYSSDSQEVNIQASIRDNNIQTVAQQLGADYFLLLTLNHFSTEVKDLPSFDRKIYTHRLDANFRLANSANSGSVLGKNISASKRIPVTSKILIQASKQSILNELIDDIVGQIVDHLGNIASAHLTKPPVRAVQQNRSQTQTGASPKSNKVQVFISAKLQNLSWPEISKDENQNLTLTGTNYQLESTDAEIEIDGIFVGNSSSTEPVLIQPGLRRLKVIRSGFVVQEKMINAYEGLKLNLLLTPTDEEYKRWQSQIAFTQKIKIGEKLTDIEVKKAEGMYEFLKNSKYELPDNVTIKSLY